MDIWLIEKEEGMNIKPVSVHGMLWLQTHFETENWEDLSRNQVIIPISDSKFLANDAEEAGLTVNYLPVLSISETF